nr:Rap1a/Tai family immunity protein [uncultured Neokomagataea sp.]
MKKLVAFTAAASLLALGSTAHAQRVSKVSGGKLGAMCSNARSASLCDAYIAGVTDSEVWSKKYDEHMNDGNAPVAFCVPDSETTAHLRESVVSWLHRHNDALTQAAGQGIYRALHEAYPCHGTTEDKK